MVKYIKLLESDMERSEIVQAVKGVVDELQSIAENLSKIKIEKITAIVDRIKVEYGLQIAENFNNVATEEIEQCIDVVIDTKDKIDTEALKLSGDVESDIDSDFGDEEEELEDELEDELDSDFGDEEELEASPKELERELKDWYYPRRKLL